MEATTKACEFNGMLVVKRNDENPHQRFVKGRRKS